MPLLNKKTMAGFKLATIWSCVTFVYKLISLFNNYKAFHDGFEFHNVFSFSQRFIIHGMKFLHNFLLLYIPSIHNLSIKKYETGLERDPHFVGCCGNQLRPRDPGGLSPRLQYSNVLILDLL